MRDAENLEIYLLGDINCDLLAESPDNCTKELLSISTIYNLSQIISQPTRITIFSYCAPVWDGIGVTLSDRLQKLQNRAARVITQSTYDISSRDLLDELQWNSLSINR